MDYMTNTFKYSNGKDQSVISKICNDVILKGKENYHKSYRKFSNTFNLFKAQKS